MQHTTRWGGSSGRSKMGCGTTGACRHTRHTTMRRDCTSHLALTTAGRRQGRFTTKRPTMRSEGTNRNGWRRMHMKVRHNFHIIHLKHVRELETSLEGSSPSGLRSYDVMI